MTKNYYNVVSDNLNEYSVLRENNSIVITEIPYKVQAELFCDELNELADENNELKQIINDYYKVEVNAGHQYRIYVADTLKKYFDKMKGKTVYASLIEYIAEDLGVDLYD